jgi:putative FmdB family regulatory protein
MPIYAYRCESCGFAQDTLRKMSDPPLSICPECGKDTFRKQVTAAGFQLKGSGWYVTDFRNNGSAPAKAARKDGESGTGTSAGAADGAAGGSGDAGKADAAGKPGGAAGGDSGSTAGSSGGAAAAGGSGGAASSGTSSTPAPSSGSKPSSGGTSSS